MVIPRSRSSGALSIVSKARYSASPLRARYLVIAAVRLVLPWSMWPIVPILTCGLVRSNFFLAIWAAPGFLLDLGLLDEFRGQVARHLGVVAEFHRGRRPALGHRPQVRDVSEHLGERDERPDDLRRPARLHALDLPPAAVEVADDVAHELLGHEDLDLHDRLEDGRIRLREGVLDGHRSGDLERHLGRVDVVVRPVEQGDLDVDDREAGVDARGERLADALVDRLDVLARDRAADDLVDELVARALLLRLELDHRVAVLALAAGLADEAAVALGGAPDRLAVGDLRLADVRGDLELADHPVDEDVEMQLAHAGDQGLGRLRVGVDAEGGVFLGEPLEGDRELVLVGLRLRLDLDLDDRLRERHRFEDHRMLGVRERVAGERVLEADGRGDVAGVDLVDLLAVVGVHLEDAADALALALRRVEDVRAGLERARIDPEERELADERVGRDLEGERAERLV